MDSKETNSERMSRLFKERTGIPYQNWIQGLSVTLNNSLSKQKKKRVIEVYSDDVCRVDENGGPYKVSVDE
jgi:hypothetical protein